MPSPVPSKRPFARWDRIQTALGKASDANKPTPCGHSRPKRFAVRGRHRLPPPPCCHPGSRPPTALLVSSIETTKEPALSSPSPPLEERAGERRGNSTSRDPQDRVRPPIARLLDQ